jgi:hypothetical protein
MVDCSVVSQRPNNSHGGGTNQLQQRRHQCQMGIEEGKSVAAEVTPVPGIEE